MTDPDRGPVVPIGADPERDKRRAAYKARERARMSRAFDKWIMYAYGGEPDVSERQANQDQDRWG